MLAKRIANLQFLKTYIESNHDDWKLAKELAERANGWFTQQFIEHACEQISQVFLDEEKLNLFADNIHYVHDVQSKKNIGLTMAGNIPLVGFHDLLCCYLSGHYVRIKMSSKDNILLTHLLQKLYEHDDEAKQDIQISEMLKACDVYIATGSNSSAQYFEKYFAKYPHIIRKNRTSIAVLNGKETPENLENLADDVYIYFGLGCRNVTKVYVPQGYNFEPMLNAFRKYDELKNHNKYRNNIDYHLAIYMLNNQYYMSNESIMMVENSSLFSPIGVLHYEFYDNEEDLDFSEQANDIQVIVGNNYAALGSSQQPSLIDYADGMNTIDFLNSLSR
jgi:hypothetical protein